MINIYDVIRNYNFIKETDSNRYIINYNNYILIITIILGNIDTYSYENYLIINSEKIFKNYKFDIQIYQYSINNKNLDDISELINELNIILRKKIRKKKLSNLI
jgi:hypothetical protein